MIEAQVEREKIGVAEYREGAGLEQRGFAETRLAEEDGERLAADEPDEFLGLLFAPKEKRPRVLGKRG